MTAAEWISALCEIGLVIGFLIVAAAILLVVVDDYRRYRQPPNQDPAGGAAVRRLRGLKPPTPQRKTSA